MKPNHGVPPKRAPFEGCPSHRSRENGRRIAVPRGLLSVILVGASVGCTWSRFDEVAKASPIQILEPPKNLQGVGTSLAAARGQSGTLAFAKGDQGYLIYGFGATDLLSRDAIDQGGCRANEGCWMGAQVAPIGQDLTTNALTCFAFGLAIGTDNLANPVLYCEGHELRRLGIPEPAPVELSGLNANTKTPRILFASGPRLAPDLLVAAMPRSGAAWFYSVNSGAPVSIPRPVDASESFGASLAVAGMGVTRFVVIADPDAGMLHLFRTDGDLAPDASLCVNASAGFASALAAGHFVAAGNEDLAVTAADGLYVLPSLETMPFSTDASAGCIPLSDLVAAPTLPCSALPPGNAGCTPATIAASDLDGDGQDELLLGMPDAASRGSDGAGKLLYASLGGPAPRVLGELSPSSAESGDRFGTSIVGVPLSRPEVVLAGAPGGNKLAALFCTSLLGPSHAYARCD